MGTITKQKVDEINKKCANGFQFDLQSFYYGRNKQVIKYIDFGDNKKLSASIYFSERRLDASYTYKLVMCLHLAIWEVEETGLMVSHGLGQSIIISDVYEKRKFSDIIARTKDFDDNKILELASQHMENLTNPFAVGGRV